MSKTKYILHFCASCGREAKMEVVGAMEGLENKMWYRCTRCHHSSMIDLAPGRSDAAILKVSRDECTSYSPERVYSVGECIYHSDWDDMGKVTRKEKTSDGGQAILVAFEKLGSRRLIENLRAEQV